MADSANLRLCMISGSFEYDSEESLRRFQADLLDRGGIEPTMIVFKDEDDAPSLAPIEQADVLLVFTRRLRTDGRELDRFKAYCAQGRPLVGVRTASHAFQNWLAFDRDVLGGNYDGHYGSGPTCHVSAAPGATDHPILRDVEPFESPGSLYRNTPIASDTIRLLDGRAADRVEPVAWTRIHQGGRVFYTSLGHPTDFREPNFVRLLHNGILWAAGRI